VFGKKLGAQFVENFVLNIEHL